MKVKNITNLVKTWRAYLSDSQVLNVNKMKRIFMQKFTSFSKLFQLQHYKTFLRLLIVILICAFPGQLV